jgi:guanylate kinase
MGNNSIIIVLSAPSGGGKSSLSKKIIEQNENIILSISATTRKKRDLEIEGKHYFFRSEGEFQEMIKADQFLEYAKIYNNYYGTQRKFINKQIEENKDVLFDIDYQGMKQIKEHLADRVLSIFIKPPSIDALKSRLKERNQDSYKAINIRIDHAKDEIETSKYYDHIVINDNFEYALAEINKIIKNKKSMLI